MTAEFSSSNCTLLELKLLTAHPFMDFKTLFKLYLAGIETIHNQPAIGVDGCSNCTLLELKQLCPNFSPAPCRPFKLYLAGIETSSICFVPNLVARRSNCTLLELKLFFYFFFVHSRTFKLYLAGIETTKSKFASSSAQEFKLHLTGIETKLALRLRCPSVCSNCTLLELKQNSL